MKVSKNLLGLWRRVKILPAAATKMTKELKLTAPKNDIVIKTRIYELEVDL